MTFFGKPVDGLLIGEKKGKKEGMVPNASGDFLPFLGEIQALGESKHGSCSTSVMRKLRVHSEQRLRPPASPSGAYDLPIAGQALRHKLTLIT